MKKSVSPAGAPAWLVDDYDTVKKLLADPRLSRFSHPDPPNAPRFTGAEIVGAPLHDVSLDDLRDQAIREFIAPSIKLSRLTELKDLILTEVDRALSDLHGATVPADILSIVAYPVPASVISSLIGIPREYHSAVCGLAYRAGNIENLELSSQASDELCQLVLQIMDQRRNEDGDDIILRVVRALATEKYDGFNPGHFAEMIKGVQIAGQMNTAATIERGIMLLLSNQVDTAGIIADEERLDRVVEEVLRCPHPMYGKNSGIPRYALEDITSDDQTVKSGDLVILDTETANIDPSVFDTPGMFDTAREPNPHLTFGFGRHFCIGSGLARLEIRTILLRLFREFPNLRVANQEFAQCTDQLVGGLRELYVEW